MGQFNDSYPPIMDGVANTVKNYGLWLNRKYGQSYIVTPSYPQYKDDDEFDIIRYKSIGLIGRPPYRLGLPHLDRDLKNTLQSIDFDIVHAHSPFSSGQVALKIAREKKIPIVATFHSKFYDDFKQSLKFDGLASLAVKKVVQFFEKVDSVWAVNNGTAETLRSYGYQGEITVVQNGTDFDHSNNDDDRKYINDMYNIKDEDIALLFVGQHIWQKNLKMLIESLRYLKDKNVNFKMFFVGQGYATNDMKQLVKEYKMNDNITFVGMLTDREILKKFFIRADLFLFPSIYDNAPIVVREAAAAKCPSLLIKNTNAAEGIIDGYNGYVTENDPHIYANKLLDILHDGDTMKNVSKNAQKTIAKSWESLIDEVYERYKELILYNKTQKY